MTASHLKIASINIERRTHLSRLLPFLEDQAADVICLQELEAQDLELFSTRLNVPHVHFVPMCRHPNARDIGSFGVAVLSKPQLLNPQTLHYYGKGDGTAILDRTSAETRIETTRFAAAAAFVPLGDTAVMFATTHFPWTPDGEPRPFQFEAVESLMSMTDAAAADHPLVLTGDFNAPRGGPIFGRLAAHYRDNIPAHVTSSLDPDLHRAAPLELMVDGVFSNARCTVSDVALHTGVSDHQAVTATLHLPAR
ncbi:MAG: endonuclease/exonuclease/phosphatase family protein [Pseudomonadota bacterium]